MPNQWTKFIEDYATKHNVSYMCAMQIINNDPDKMGYVKQTKESKKQELLQKVNDYSIVFNKGLALDKKNNNTDYIDKQRQRFIRFDEDFKKKLLKKYPEIYNKLDLSEKNKMRKMITRANDISYLYETEYNNIKDALDNNVKIQRDTKKYMKDLYKEYMLIKETLESKNIKELDDLYSPKELGL